MSDAEWYFTQHGREAGPVSLQQLRQNISAGEVHASEMAWTNGMAEWVRISHIAALQSTESPREIETSVTKNPLPSPLTGYREREQLSQPAEPMPVGVQTAPPLATAVSYYSPAGDLPQRAAVTLRGHAMPSGDVGDWPMDDARVAQFQEAVKLRKRVTGAALLYRALLLISLITAAAMAICSVVEFSSSGRTSVSEGIGFLIMTGVTSAFAVLYYLVWRATMRSHRWAPLTMFILFLLAVMMNLTSLLFGVAGVAITGVFAAAIAGAFAVVSWRSYAAIPRYLAQPAWCQELLIKANL